VDLQSLVNELIYDDTLRDSLPLFKPELALCATIVVLLLARVLPLFRLLPPFLLALAGSLTALWLALPAEGLADWSAPSQEIFTGMLVVDAVTAYIRVFLMSFAVLLVVLAQLTGLAGRDDGQDFFVLMLGATLGMCIMASSNHMLSVFLGVEMASVPSYVLAGIVRGRRTSSEASLKYAVYGAGTAGVMLYGISLLCGVLGSAHLPTMAARLAELDLAAKLASPDESVTVMVLALGGLMLGVGLAFKLSAVPFHFWCPDVFEGASAEVDAFLSVASKAAALVLLVRIGLGFSYVQETPQIALHEARPPAAVAAAELANSKISALPVVNSVARVSVANESESEASPLAPVRSFAVLLISVVAMVTCTFGNLAAYGQTNIKRLLAYSTIAHAGYMMMAVAAAVALLDHGLAQSQNAVSSLLIYATIYLFMNLGAFAIVAFLRNAMGSEELADYGGLVRSCPVISVCMVAILFSLVGIPPLAGFIGKFAIFMSLVEMGGPLMMTLLVVAGLNTVVSLIYYLRVARTICMDPEPDSRGPVAFGFLPAAYVLVASVPVLALGLWPDRLAQWADLAASSLFR